MNLTPHVITSSVLTVLFFPVFGWHSLWIIVGGFCIDVDHYVYYGLKFKKWSLKKAYYFYKVAQSHEGYMRDNLHVFHTAEFLVVMVLGIFVGLAAQWTFFLYMCVVTLVGVVCHWMLDWVNMAFRDVWEARALSTTGWLWRRRRG